MGSEVIATCQCGLNTSIMIGGGMFNFMTKCYFPCICERCHAVVPVNLLAKRKRCPQCRTTKVIPYDNPTLSDSQGQCIVANWDMEEELGRELKLTDANYRCPKCGQMTLHFEDSCLCWD